MSKAKPWLWLLVASLALNVFLGVALGTHLFRGPGGAKGPPGPNAMLTDMANALPEADARILRQAIEARRAEMIDDQPGRGFEQLRAVLAAEPFDAEAFARISGEFRARHERNGRITGEILADALPRMSPKGRQALANRPPPRPR